MEKLACHDYGPCPCTVVPCSADAYVITPTVIDGDGSKPLNTVRVFSKASNRLLRTFHVPWCALQTAQPVMVP